MADSKPSLAAPAPASRPQAHPPDQEARFAGLLLGMAPANFAMVMSTGIVSVALSLLGYTDGANLLFGLNVLLFIALAVLYVLRLARFPRRFGEDFADHEKGPGFLTLVAGTCILGNQVALLGRNPELAELLFWTGVFLWLLILWGVFYCIFTRNPKPPIENGINGAWLVATVSTQSIVILGSILAPSTGWNLETAFFCLSALFLLGLMLYIVIITMIFYRYCYKNLEPAQLSPTYWINAGAVAITTLAGSELMLRVGSSRLLDEFLPFIKGATLLAWATASFWIPMLFLLGWWRHFRRRYPFSYTAEYWGMVFPLGMYTACTVMLARALDFAPLLHLPRLFIFVACAAWLATFTGMIWSRSRDLFNREGV